MTRYPDWNARLQACIVKWQAMTFEYGKSDCAMWTAAAVEAMTGVDVVDGLRDYGSAEEGLALAQSKGFDDHIGVFESALPTSDRVKVGDVAVIEYKGELALGIAQVRGVYVMTLDRGLALVPRSWIKHGMTV